ncbi:Fe-Mn family superoxide dismutase [Candidatus Providencia siddallii]|uniref:Superoxide dismutase n=1 Tax=Candidatus Providencia siddallii TaxID=1715285 RepID=A0ABM9NPD1_9GAMM
MNCKLPELSYKYDALEPFFDKMTMEIHYTKHHQTYVNNINSELKKLPEFSNLEFDNLIEKLNILSCDKYLLLRNNIGGHLNHSFFWKCLGLGSVLEGKLKETINCNFGSIENFKENFEKIAIKHFGSGWVWLILKSNKKLDIVSTNNQDTLLMKKNILENYEYPIFCLDLWEHAYYLKFQNRRSDYVKTFWSVINWYEASNRFELKI